MNDGTEKSKMLKIIDFETIQPIWQSQLWPQRHSAIESVSAINEVGDIDNIIMNNEPIFFGYFQKDQLIGVNSCHRTSKEMMRSRGLWVHPAFRSRGVGRKLVLALVPVARNNEASTLWTMARQASVGFYLRLGFAKYAETTKYEFGPHFFCQYEI